MVGKERESLVDDAYPNDRGGDSDTSSGRDASHSSLDEERRDRERFAATRPWRRILCVFGFHFHSEIWPGMWRTSCLTCGRYFDDDPS